MFDFRRLKEDAIPTIGLGSPSDRATQTKGQPFLGFTRNEELAMFTQDDDPLETEDDHQVWTLNLSLLMSIFVKKNH